MRSELTNLPGVVQADITLDGKGVVLYDPGRVDVTKIVAASDSVFPTELVKDEPVAPGSQ